VPDRIRLLTLDDAPALSELRLRSRAFLAPWEPIRHPDHDTPAGQRADVEAALAQHARGQGVPLAILDDDGSVAGRINLTGIVRGAFESCTAGYWLAEERTGRGLATGAVRAAVDLAFGDLGLHRARPARCSATGPRRRSSPVRASRAMGRHRGTSASRGSGRTTCCSSD
jgi:ribosomal-protein-alanine N-acetyltransferase